MFLSTCFGGRRRTEARSARRPSSFRPRVEELEPRQVLSTFTVLNTNNDGPGSLRQAIVDANDHANVGGPDVIAFQIAGAGVYSIQPAWELDVVADAVIIDGTTQPGYAGRPLIELDGSLIHVDASGLILSRGNSTVKGLVINRFSASGIIAGSDGNVIEGNFLGTDATGTHALGNGIGVTVDGRLNRIGSNGDGVGDAAERNLISGNLGAGVVLVPRFQLFGPSPPPPPAQHNLVAGNFIGTDVTGAQPLGNGLQGKLLLRSFVDFVIVTDPQGNPSVAAVRAFAPAVEMGSSARGPGVVTFGSGNQIGGPGALANRIAFNGAAGVAIQSPNAPGFPIAPPGTGNSIRGNAIFANGGPAIDLGGDGVTLNDAADGDGGANQQQNFPTILEVFRGPRATRIAGTLNSLPGTTYTLDFYASATADPSGFGQAQRYLGSAQATTDGSGNARFEALLPVKTHPGEIVSATATDAGGNTSEFSFAPHGHAVALVLGGRLTIVGGGPSQAIRIAAAGAPNSYTVTTGDGTWVVRHVVKGIDIHLAGGNSAVYLDGSVTPLAVAGAVNIRTAARDDAVWMQAVQVQGKTAINSGAGNNRLTLIDAVFAGDLAIATAAGADQVNVRGSLCAGAVTIDTAAGDDGVNVQRSLFARAVSIATGDGADRVDIDAAPGNPGLVSTFQGRVSILTGAGQDRIVIGQEPRFGQPYVQVPFLDELFVDGGADFDSLKGLAMNAPLNRIDNVEDVFIIPPGGFGDA